MLFLIHNTFIFLSISLRPYMNITVNNNDEDLSCRIFISLRSRPSISYYVIDTPELVTIHLRFSRFFKIPRINIARMIAGIRGNLRVLETCNPSITINCAMPPATERREWYINRVTKLLSSGSLWDVIFSPPESGTTYTCIRR